MGNKLNSNFLSQNSYKPYYNQIQKFEQIKIMSNIQLKRNLSSTGAAGRSGGSIMKKKGGYDATLNDRSNDDISDYIGGTQNSTHRMGTIAEVQRGNPDMIDEIEQSQSYMMEGSIRDTNRKLVRIEGLTDFLIQENYKKIGIYKTDPEVLFYFWRDYVSVDKRELRELQQASSKSVQPNYEQDAAPLNLPKSKSVLSAKKNYIRDQSNQKYHFKWPVHKKDDLENGIKRGEQKSLDELNLFEKYDYFGVWPEMDVRKTIQDAVDEINIQKLKKENDEQESADKLLMDQLRKSKQGKMNEMFEAYYEQVMFRQLKLHQKTLKDKSSPKKGSSAKKGAKDDDEEDDYEEDDFEKPVKQSPGEQAIAAVLAKTWDDKVKLLQNDVLDEKTMRHFVKDTLDAIGPTNKFTTENFRSVFRRFDIQVVIDKKKAEEQKKGGKKAPKGDMNIYTAIQNKNTQVISQFIMTLMDNAIDITIFQKSQKKYLTEVQVLKEEVAKKDAKFVKQLEKSLEDQKHDMRAIMSAVFFPANAKPGSLTTGSFTKSSIPKDFTNTPKEIMKSFASGGRQVALKGATSPKSLVDEFFKMDNIIDRIRLLRDKINKSKRKSSNTTEQSYYLNVSPEERLLYMISIESTESYKILLDFKVKTGYNVLNEILKANPSKKTDEKKMLKEAENGTITDLFKEYSDRDKLQKIDFHNTQQEFFQKKEVEKANTIKKAVFGDKWNEERQELTVKKKTDAEQAVPKDKWKVGRQLKELQRQFPHDRVIQRMVEQEFKTNQTFAYPEEYDIRDQALQKSLKKNFEPDQQQHGITWKVPDFTKEKEIMEAFQGRDRYFEKQYNREYREIIKEEQRVETYMVESAMDYHQYMSDRSKQSKGDKRETLRQKLAQYYHGLIKDENMGDVAKRRFPHISYGQDPESETFKKSYPSSFKRYFFKLVKNIIISKKTGQKKIPTNPPTLKMTVGARHNTKMDPLVMTTMNTELKEFKVGMHITNLKLKGKVPTTWRSRVFRKPDQKKNLKNIFMKQDEVDNCTFEPNAYRLVQNMTSHQEKFIDENEKVPQPGTFFDSLGTNFEKSDPAIFKQGKLKKAKIHLRQGAVDECIATLIEGFNLIKVYQHNKPDEYKIFQDYTEAMEKLQASSKKQMKELTGKGARLKDTDDCGLTWEQEQDVKKTFDENKTLKEDEVKAKDGSMQKVPVEMLDIRKLDKCMRNLGFMPKTVEITELLKLIQKEKDKVKEQNKMNNVIKDVHYSYIDFDRFKEIMRSKLVQDRSLNDLKAAFKILDRDGSGSIDADEFRDVMRGLSANFSEEEIEKMVVAADVDGDKQISEDEFIMVMRKNKKGKNANSDLVREMQFQVNRFLNQKELERKFNQLHTYEKKFLAFIQNKQEDERMSKNTDGQAKPKGEDMDKATLKAVYNDLWDIMVWLLNLEKEKEKNMKKMAKQGAALKRTKGDLEDKQEETMRIYKSIMCPMKFECPKVKRLRFPYSNLKANRKFGEDCPYAHHPMELQFPQTIDIRMAANKTLGKEKKNQQAEKVTTFVFSGGLFDCKGCGAHCNMCNYKAAAKTMEAKFSEHAPSKAVDKDRVYGIKEANNAKANQFAQKFGILKKASVLLFYGRANDAFEEVAKAAQIIKDQKAEKDRARDDAFYTQLIEDYDLQQVEGELEPLREQLDKLREADINDAFLKQIDPKRGHWAGLKLYFRKACPLIKNQYDRETFLNGLIEDLYFNCEDIILDKQKTKDRIEKLEKLIPEAEDDIDEEELMAQNEDPDNPIKYKRKKKSMCESIQKRKYYKDEGLDMKRTVTVKENDVVEKKEMDKYFIDNKYVRQNITAPNGRQRCVVCPLGKECPHAHTAIQLDLTKMQTKKENLQRVVKSLDKKMKKDKALEPWRPSAADFKASDLPDFVIKKVMKDDEDKETEANKKKEKPPRKGILERENIFRKPYEKGV